MILTVSLNAALDKTYLLPGFTAGGLGKPARTLAMAGGKGINVARLLAALGEPALVVGIVAGHTGAHIASCLDAEGLPHALSVLKEGESRTCVAIVDPLNECLTEVHETGMTVAPSDFEGFLARFEQHAPRASHVALSGSLPPGLDAGAYVTLMQAARAHGCTVSLDTGPAALGAVLEAGPDLIKPNQPEAEALLGFAIGPDTLREALDALLGLGARAVALSLGAAGAAYAGPAGCFFFAAPRVPVVSAIGSGDAFLAAWLHATARGAGVPEAGRWAVAAGSANATVAGAAACDRAAIEAILPHVAVHELASAPAWGEPRSLA